MKCSHRRTKFALTSRLGSLVIAAAILMGLSSCGTNDPRQCFVPPNISSISPKAASAGGPEFTITVTGDSFYVNSVVQWNEGNRQTTVVNASELTAVITADDIANAGAAYVRVETPLASNAGNLYCAGDSESLRFAINP